MKKYARSYSNGIIKGKDGNMNDPLVQFEANKPAIKDLFRDLLTKMKGLKYQITLTVYVSKDKGKEGLEYATVCFNSTVEKVWS